MFTPDMISTLYVSKEFGDDRASFGFSPEKKYRAEGPLKTLEQALFYITELRLNGHDQPITIVMMDEEYEISKPVVLTPEMHSITIKPYTKTVFSGGFTIKGFKKDVFNGTECFSAYVPEIREKGIWFTDLYVDGARAQFTKYPKKGTLEPSEVETEEDWLHTPVSWFKTQKEDLETISKFRNFGDCFISYNHYWIDEHSPIKSYDLESGKIEFEYPSRFSLCPTQPHTALHYIIENVAESFENPNEWYLDRETSMVYYIPRNENQTPENIKVVAPLTDKLFILQGKNENKLSYVHFENLDFAYTKGDYKSEFVDPKTGELTYRASDAQSVAQAHGSIELYYTHGCAMENCNLYCLGVHALTVNEGCTGTKLCNNHIYDIGAGGIKIGGEGYLFDAEGNATLDDLNQNSGNTVKNNRIERCGRRYFAGCGILVKHSFENYIGHNEISDLYYTGISVGWVWGYKPSVTRDNLIEKNLIYNIGMGALSDMGGIYTLGKQPGTVIRGNVIHDVTTYDYGAWGIYLDEGSSYITVENNLCYKVGKNGFNQHFGQMNTIRNNIFAKTGHCAARVSLWHINNRAIFEKNILVTDGKSSYSSMIDGDSIAPNQIIATSNLHYNVSGPVSAMGEKEKISLEEFQTAYGNDKYSIEADPMFVDYENNDFRLKPESPAYKIGFRDIDFSDVGIQ
ncbi:MAG: right-handed parallel beta-helix repeat-containing protein [Clostridia bacterium]|nr:right-handed parallel beta-helix repeat-containing protein [Clostridia bacterium]